jgi:chemotaxis response regulator CheB
LSIANLFSPAGREQLKINRVLIVDDDAIFRRFLKDHLSGKPGLEVVGEAEDGRKALEQAEALNPDLILMDSRMPKLNGFKASHLLLERCPILKSSSWPSSITLRTNRLLENVGLAAMSRN